MGGSGGRVNKQPLRVENSPLGLRAVRTIRCTEKNLSGILAELTAESSLFDATIEERTRSIVDAVRERGDAALLEFTERFDGAKLSAGQLAVSKAELMAASLKVDEAMRDALGVAKKNVERFSKRGLRKGWSIQNTEGGQVGEKFDPFQRVGVYIPGGTAPLVSTALMTVVLAKVAGCREIVVCTPCGAGGEVHPGLLYAARLAGATEIYRVGGAQAIAAMSWGTETIRPVQKVFGPGNAYVVMAKRLLFGRVAVDLLPGPSEMLVMADETAKAELVAADMLAQAEHGSGHERVWLVTTSKALLAEVKKEIQVQVRERVRAKHIRKALKQQGCLMLVENVDQAVTVANGLAPEHCEIMMRQGEKVSERIVTAGAIFIGAWSPTVLGDYMAGPSHTLPTGGAGASFAGLTVDQFQRRTSVVRYDRAALKKSLPTVATLAGAEGLEGHANSAAIRFARRKK
jgi:histidinol dehydrogenase